MLRFLGRGSAFQTQEGNTSAYIKEDGKLFLIDCGSNIFSSMMQQGFLDDVNEVHVAITHRHSDHVGSLGDLIFYCYHKKKIRLCLHTDDERFADFLWMIGVSEDQYQRFHGGPVESMGLGIRFLPCSHAAIYQSPDGSLSKDPGAMSQNVFPCYSIVLEHNGRKCFYSGDTNHVPWNELRGLDAYYVDTTISNYPDNAHYNVDLLYKDCTAIDASLVQKVWCMHLNSDSTIRRAEELGFHVVQVEDGI